MALRCLLFTADEAAAEPIRQVLAGLGVEGEHCAGAADAVERVANQNFQIVIIDWDPQSEAGQVLKAARERKAAERPLTLALVSEDANVPQALQAGANSILRKPILVNQVKDTLTTARDLLRAKESAAQNAATAAAAKPAALPASLQEGNEKSLRAGEFLQSAGPMPGAQFDTESDLPDFSSPESAEPMDALAELEPMAAAVAPTAPREEPTAAPAAQSDEPKGLQFYLNRKAGSLPPVPGRGPAASPVVAPSAAPEKVELLGYDQSVSPESSVSSPAPSFRTQKVEPLPSFEVKSIPSESHPQSAEPDAEVPGKESSETRQGFRLGKGAIAAALALAACALVAAPQAPWHARVASLWGHGHQALHAWLNPQVETKTAQAPTAHEDFARAGDEYKLPVAENIPDATTDPTQIRVTPVVDPTAKKADAANTDAPAPADSPDAKEPSQIQVQPSQVQPVQVQPVPSSSVPGQTPNASPGAAANSAPTITTPPSAPAATPTPPPPAPRVVPTSGTRSAPTLSTSNATNTPPIPSSLTSQMASMTPAAGGDKPPETAMQAIEPVNVPEQAERALLLDQPAIGYPDTAKGQQGTVVLLVQIGRDGTVQDAKFLQGSLAFARAAIEGVKAWKFKPYVMNGRAVSVTTQLSMSFKPGM